MNYEKLGANHAAATGDDVTLISGRQSPELDVVGGPPSSPDHCQIVDERMPEKIIISPVGPPPIRARENKVRRWKNFRAWKLSAAAPRRVKQGNGTNGATQETGEQQHAAHSSTLFTDMEESTLSLVPPISPCLEGTCLFAQQLKHEMDSVWLGCEFKEEETGVKCNYWVHAKCHGFAKMSKRVLKMAKGFRCPDHLL